MNVGQSKVIKLIKLNLCDTVNEVKNLPCFSQERE